MEGVKYYLSFDCGTKTFAYTFVKINHNYLTLDNIKEFKKIVSFITTQSDITLYSDILFKIDYIINNTINIIFSNCLDLLPEKNNNEISTIERVKLVSNHIKMHIIPLIQDIPQDLINVLVEFQMSHNTQSKIISIIILTMFHEYNIELVHPTHKNKISLSENGKLSHFIEKYKTSYNANKQHAIYNFNLFESTFEQYINVSDTLKGHIADAFMQIIGKKLNS